MMKQKTEIGQVFLVPLDDGRCAIGQIIGVESQALNSITCIFSKETTPPIGPSGCSGIADTESIAALFTTSDLLKRGRWAVISKADVTFPKTKYPNEQYRSKGWVGAKVIGSRIVEDFLNAFHGLRYWDDWKDPKYLDGLLLPGTTRPTNVKLKAQPTAAASPSVGK